MNSFSNEFIGFSNKHGQMIYQFDRAFSEEEEDLIFNRNKGGPNSKNVEFDADVLLFFDNNGISIVADNLNKKVTCKKFICPKYSDTIDLVNRTKIIRQPQHVFVMAGIKDYDDGDTTYVMKNVDILLDTLRKKFPTCKIVISSVLPRKRFDPLSREVRILNKHIEDACAALAKCSYMDNTPYINSNLLRDCVTLNEAGVFKLITNMKFYLFGLIEFPKTEKPLSGYSKTRERQRWKVYN